MDKKNYLFIRVACAIILVSLYVDVIGNEVVSSNSLNEANLLVPLLNIQLYNLNFFHTSTIHKITWFFTLMEFKFT